MAAATHETTVKEFAEKHGVTGPVASNTLNFMAAKGMAEQTGQRPPAGGRGRPCLVYTIRDKARIDDL